MNTTKYASSDSYEYVDGMLIMHTFSNVCYHADRCVQCSSRCLGEGTVQGGKCWILLQGDTRRRFMHRVRVTTGSSSHTSNKSNLIDSHRLNNVKICFVSCFGEIHVLHRSSFSVSFFVFFGFDSSVLKTPKSSLSYFVFQVYVILLNQPGSPEK